MKANFLVEFTMGKYNLNYKSHIYKIKTMTKTSTKHPSKSIFKILNYKLVYKLPDKCQKEKVIICDF